MSSHLQNPLCSLVVQNLKTNKLLKLPFKCCSVGDDYSCYTREEEEGGKPVLL